MARREALQQLQNRIAHMLQQASANTGLAASWLGVRIGGHRLLFPLQQSGEIYPAAPVTPLPYAKPWFLGVAALRGSIFGVVDLRPFLGAAADDAAPEPPRAPARAATHLVGINAALGVNVVLRVDALEGLRGRDAFDRSASASADAPAYFGSSFVDHAGLSWQEINLQALTREASFLDIAEQAQPAATTAAS